MGTPKANERMVFLDGMRGLAAIMVVLGHATFILGYKAFNSYLSVDFFFLLSGFVIAAGYDQRIDSGAISSGQFIRARLIRLYPMYFASIAFATITCFIWPFLYHGAGASQADIAKCSALALVYIPCRMGDSNELFTVNNVVWSLMFEVILNILYVFTRPKLSIRIHIFIVAASAAIICGSAIFIGHINFGPFHTPNSFILGIVRSTFGIFGGVLLYRLKDIKIFERISHFPTWLALVLLIAPLALPALSRTFDALTAIVYILVIAPVAILSGARAKGRNALFSFLGAASYPLYLFHFPILRGVEAAFPHQAPPFPYGFIFLAALISICGLIESQVDIPLRRWVQQRIRKSYLATPNG